MRDAANAPPYCPFGELLEVLARPWVLQILWVLSTHGPTRFGALRRQVAGISSRVLTERLRILEQRGFVFRNYEPTIPPAVTYGITSRMKDIGKVLEDLDALARKWQQEDAHLRAKPDGKVGGGKVRTRHAEVREDVHA